MKYHFSTVIAALGCLFLVSCYPYNENKGQKKASDKTEKTVTSAEQQKLQEQRDKLKAQEEAKKKEDPTQGNVTPTNGTTETKPDLPKAPSDEKRDYAFANKVPGKEGFVFSPYNNKIVDVREIPSGTLVQDPTYTGAGKGYFRVP